MNEQEKSLELAEVMGWERSELGGVSFWEGENIDLYHTTLCPYSSCNAGKAQFAAILLRFPEVMERFTEAGSMLDDATMMRNGMKPTQANILDEILRMNGIEP